MSMHVVILAAGASSRMGQDKAWLTYRGEPWLAWQVQRITDALACPITVVRQSSDTALEDFCARHPNVGTAFNPHVDQGPFSSLQAGLASITTEYTMVLPIDVPASEPHVWISLCSMLHTYMVALPSHRGRNGHPVAFNRQVRDALLQVPSDSADARLDVQLRRYERSVVQVNDALVTMNLNDPDNWNAFQAL